MIPLHPLLLPHFFISLSSKTSWKSCLHLFPISFPLFFLQATPLRLFLSRSLMTSMPLNPVVSSQSSSYVTHQQHWAHRDTVFKLASRTQVLLLRSVAGFSLWPWSLALDWPFPLLTLKGLVEEEPRIEMRRKDKRVRRSSMRELSCGIKGREF